MTVHLVGLFQAAARDHAGRPALRRPRDGDFEVLTHEQVWELGLGVAARLREHGVVAGDRVVLQAASGVDWVLCYLGILAAGGTALPLDAQDSRTRRERVRELAGARVAIVDDEALGGVRADELCPVTLTTDPPDLAASTALGLPHDPAPETAASILFTSGTTERPKGVVLSHRAFVANVESIRTVFRHDANDRLVSILPLHHAFEFTAGLLSPLSAGGSVAYLARPDGAELVAAMRKLRATVVLGVPRLFELLLAGIESRRGALPTVPRVFVEDLTRLSRRLHLLGLPAGKVLLYPLHRSFGGSLRFFACGGAALPPDLEEEYAALGFSILQGYGLTEAAPVLTVNRPGQARVGTAGPPLPGVEVRLHEPDAEGIGEVLARGDNLMTGYLDDEEATRARLRDGWLHTGDLGCFDEAGHLVLTGRALDLIVTPAGKNVYPDELETVFHDLPDVAELCVVGFSRPGESSELPHLVIRPEAGSDATTRERIEELVKERCRGLPSHQRVQGVHFVEDELPKTRLMKVQRSRVKRLLVEHGTAGDAKAGGLPEQPTEVERVLVLLSRLTGRPRHALHAEDHLSFDLGLDSLGRGEILTSMENGGLTLPEGVGENLENVADLIELASSGGSTSATDTSSDAVIGPLLARLIAPLLRVTARQLYRYWFTLDTRGLERLPTDGPFLLAANHQSHLDAGAVLAALRPTGRRVRVVAARDYFFDTPTKGAFFSSLLGAVPFDRHGGHERGFARCREVLASGQPLLIFPEGTRSLDGRLQAFKPGVGRLALETGVPVVPVRIEGAHEALPKGARWPKRHPLRVLLGEPLVPGPSELDDPSAAERFVATVRARIEALGQRAT
ncbi:MAG: AMP-binding protein [Acidobacteriota bacterium]